MTSMTEAPLETGSLAAEMAAVPVILLSNELAVLWANPEAENWLGRSMQTLVKSGLAMATPIGAPLAELAEQAIAEQRSRVAVSRSLADGRSYDLHIRWADEREIVVITALPHLNGETLATQDAALGFGRMLAHELKNPLASVRGAAQLIRGQTSDPEIAELSELIVEDVDRVTRLADHWSQVGDITLGQTEPVNLNRLAMTACESLSRGQGRSIEVVLDQLDPSLPATQGDPDLLHQAILNLLQNASDALGDAEAGRIEIQTGFDAGPRSRTETGIAPLVISVIDNGPGVPEALGPGVFTPFVTTKPAGEGLGLAFAARIAALHDGQLDYQSEVGRTAFSFRLPVSAETD
jgi:two-component system nitrogen regulation sensor histidine kinase GlnL